MPAVGHRQQFFRPHFGPGLGSRRSLERLFDFGLDGDQRAHDRSSLVSGFEIVQYTIRARDRAGRRSPAEEGAATARPARDLIPADVDVSRDHGEEEDPIGRALPTDSGRVGPGWIGSGLDSRPTGKAPTESGPIARAVTPLRRLPL